MFCKDLHRNKYPKYYGIKSIINHLLCNSRVPREDYEKVVWERDQFEKRCRKQ